MRILARYLSRVTGTRLTDVTSGFRAHNRAAIELFARSYPADYLSDTIESLIIVAERRRTGPSGPGDDAAPARRFAQPIPGAGRPLPPAGRGLPGAFGVPPRAPTPTKQPRTEALMTGVHIIALVSALVTLSVIVELSRRRHLHEKYAVMWLSRRRRHRRLRHLSRPVQLHRPRRRREEPTGPAGRDRRCCSSSPSASGSVGRSAGSKTTPGPWPKRWRSSGRTWTTVPSSEPRPSWSTGRERRAGKDVGTQRDQSGRIICTDGGSGGRYRVGTQLTAQHRHLPRDTGPLGRPAPGARGNRPTSRPGRLLPRSVGRSRDCRAHAPHDRWG